MLAHEHIVDFAAQALAANTSAEAFICAMPNMKEDTSARRNAIRDVAAEMDAQSAQRTGSYEEGHGGIAMAG